LVAGVAVTGAERDDPAARVDALVAAIGPRLGSLALNRRNVVLVTGPWLSGVSSVAAVLRERVPQHTFIESLDLGPGDAPMAVVFVVSAVAQLTESDCVLLDAAAEHTDVVVGVVSKIDVHLTWPDVLAADRATLAAHAPRYGEVLWVGVAARPGVGAARVDDLVAAVQGQLADSDVARRNRLRAWESRLEMVARRFDRDAEGAGRRARVDALRDERSAALRQRRQLRSEHTISLRGQIQQARVDLTHFARESCSALRSELQADIAGLSRRQLGGFEAHTRERVQSVQAEVAEGTAAHLAAVTRATGVPAHLPPLDNLPTVDIGPTPLKSRQLETQLLMLLGAVFGLGVALTLTRVVADLAPGLTLAGMAVGIAIGAAVSFWVVSIRTLLHNRAQLDRWTGDVTTSLRSAVEQMVASGVLVAETVLSTELAARDEVENTRVADQVSVIDSELREHAIAAARAAAVRDREMPTINAALEAVRAELGEPGIPPAEVVPESRSANGDQF
jgi:hypothetical protein